MAASNSYFVPGYGISRAIIQREEEEDLVRIRDTLLENEMEITFDDRSREVIRTGDVKIEIGSVAEDEGSIFAEVVKRDSLEDSNKHKPPEYQWLSKSSKRRVRREMQKQRQKEMESKAEQSNSHEDEYDMKLLPLPSRLKQWRKRKLMKKTDPFGTCAGSVHHFLCGHRVIVLCPFCAYTWDKTLSKTFDECEPIGYHFKKACPKCPDRRAEEKRYRKPWIGNYPFDLWRTATFDPVYVAKERQREIRTDDISCRLFYVIAFDDFAFVPM